MDALTPPVPPGITAQQAAPPPLRQFAGAVPDGAMGAGQAMSQMPTAEQLMSKYVDEVGASLTKLAQVAGQARPDLIPILKQAVQAMVMFAGKVKTAQEQSDQGAPSGGDQGTADASAPGAGGSSALGMPQ